LAVIFGEVGGGLEHRGEHVGQELQDNGQDAQDSGQDVQDRGPDVQDGTEGRKEGRHHAGYRPARPPLGNPQIAKADGDVPVQAYIAAMPGWKRDVGRHLDALIVRAVRGVRKAVKWNSPLYGVEGRGWFLGMHRFTNYVKVAFFRGTSLRPVPLVGPTHYGG
jgi:hypothetical protein